MNDFLFCIPCLLASTIGNGILCTLFLFLFCFIGIHVLHFVQKFSSPVQKRIGLEKKPPDTQKQAPPNSAEPVYYIVERKQRRKKPRGEAREFRFK